MDAADPLLHIHWIPRQVEVKKNARELKIYAFTACRGADQDTWSVLQPKAPFGGNLCTVIPAKKDDNPLPRIDRLDFASEQIHRAEIGGEDHDFLVWILAPQRTQSIEQLLDLRL